MNNAHYRKRFYNGAVSGKTIHVGKYMDLSTSLLFSAVVYYLLCLLYTPSTLFSCMYFNMHIKYLIMLVLASHQISVLLNLWRPLKTFFFCQSKQIDLSRLLLFLSKHLKTSLIYAAIEWNVNFVCRQILGGWPP